MKNQLAIFNSDQVSRDGTSFSIGELEHGVWLTSLYGVPSNYSHDIHRPIGWSYAKGLFFEPEKVLTIGYFLLIENRDDLEIINNASKRHFNKMLFEHIDPVADRFKEAMGDVYDEDQKGWFYNGIVLYSYEGIVSKAFKNLAERVNADKDSLLDLSFLLSDFDYLGQGVFKDKGSDLCVVAHPFFRRSLSVFNNFHWIFLDELIELHKLQGVRVKLKIDMDFLGFAPTFIHSFEFEYWWGPKYSDNITDIDKGLTQYKSDEFERKYYQLDRTEFVWKHEGDLYTLELEEVRDEPAPTLSDYYGCRYVHSIWDASKNSFDHFDGAIRGYDMELMLERIGKKMTEMGRRSEYTKLFRVDGNLPLSHWKSLVTNYLQGNPQIYEYFGLPKPDVQQVLQSEAKPTALEKFVPYSINQGDGIRVYVSYHNREEELSSDRCFTSYDELHLEDGVHRVMEHFTIDVVKAFNRVNVSMDLPIEHEFILHEDYYHNVPCIFHAGTDPELKLAETLNAIKFLLQNLLRTKKDHVLSFSVSWNWDDRKVNLAFMGHVIDLLKWLNTFELIPIQRTKFKQWLDNQAIYIKANGKLSLCPVLSSIIAADGMLFLHRRLVHLDAKIMFPKNFSFRKYELEIFEDNPILEGAIENGEIQPTPSLLIQKMVCGKSGMDYSTSPYSFYLDDGADQIMRDVALIAFHWSDKISPISFE